MAGSADGRPFPPGEYPVVVVGSGPGGLQVAYSLRRLGIEVAVISDDPGPGGMFRKWPHFQRLLSWTKPHAPVPRDSRAYERYDWNSLLADEPEARNLQPRFMDGTSEFPSRPEMEANLAAFVERTGLAVRYDCRWEATRLEEGPEGRRVVLVTSDGEYRCQEAIFAVGVAEPYGPKIPGIELAHHYADVRPVETYAGRRVFILGKRNSGFELANGLLPWAGSIVLASPSPAKLSVVTRSLVGVRARYTQPFEDHALGGGVGILDAKVDQIEAAGSELVARLRRTDTGDELTLVVDDVIEATGFVCPLRDLPELGVATFGLSALPAQTTWWESATVPGIHFAGTITQAVAGLKKHGIPPNSGAVHGHRYNGRLTVDQIASRYHGIERPRPAVAPQDVVDRLLASASLAPELWHQKSYLAHALSREPDGTIRDEGIVSLAEYVDAAGPDGAAITIETDDRGSIHPAVYVRRRGRVDADAVLDESPLTDYRTAEHRNQLRALIADVLG